jgi:hypothetical protein
MKTLYILLALLHSFNPAISHAEKPPAQPYTQDAGEADLQESDIV